MPLATRLTRAIRSGPSRDSCADGVRSGRASRGGRRSESRRSRPRRRRYGDREWVEAQLDEAGDADVGCGFITWSLERSPETLDRVLERRPRAVLLSFGDPRPLAAEGARPPGVPLLCQVQSREDALAGDRGRRRRRRRAGWRGGRSRRPPRHIRPSCPRSPICSPPHRPERSCALRAASPTAGAWLQRSSSGQTAFSSDHGCGQPRRRTSRSACTTLRWPRPVTARSARASWTSRGDSTGPSGSPPASCATASPTIWHGRETELQEAGENAAREWSEGWAAGDPDRSNTFIGEAVGLIRTIEPAGAVLERMTAEAAELLERRW